MTTISLNFQLTYEQPFVTGLVILDGRQFRVRIDYSPRTIGTEGFEPANPAFPENPLRTLGTFRMTWKTSAGDTLISAKRICLGIDLLRLHKHNPQVPQGSLNVLALSEIGFEPTRGIPAALAGSQGTDFGQRVVMKYITPPPPFILNVPVVI